MILTTAERSRRSRLIQSQLFDDMRRVEIIPLLDHVLIFIQIERPDHRHMDTTTSRWDLADSEVKRPIVRRAEDYFRDFKSPGFDRVLDLDRYIGKRTKSAASPSMISILPRAGAGAVTPIGGHVTRVGNIWKCLDYVSGAVRGAPTGPTPSHARSPAGTGGVRRARFNVSTSSRSVNGLTRRGVSSREVPRSSIRSLG